MTVQRIGYELLRRLPIHLPPVSRIVQRYLLRTAPIISDQPHLPNAAAEKWRDEVAQASVMVEYGSGGSTVAAIQSVSHLVSIETDKRFLNAVQRTVLAMPNRGEFHPIHGNIGLTFEWGFPVFVRASRKRLAKWRAYAAAPWLELERIGAVPDLVFIDGRFRVACVLESLLRIPKNASCRLLLDDFVGREDIYGVVLDFATDVSYHDRMISFKRKDDFNIDLCRSLIGQYYGDCR